MTNEVKNHPNKIKPVCTKCGSSNIILNAGVTWDSGREFHYVHAVYDDGHYCGDCGAEDSHKWVTYSDDSE
jgi:hypothetical protein